MDKKEETVLDIPWGLSDNGRREKSKVDFSNEVSFVVIYYKDENMKSAPKETAVFLSISECKEDGEIVLCSTAKKGTVV